MADLSVDWIRALVGDDSIERLDATRIGEGFGFESVVARVVAEGGGRTRSLAVKFCSAASASGEEHAYTNVLAPTAVRRPSLHAVLIEGEHGIVVTDFVDGAQGDVLTGCSMVTALDIARSIADLHATWWDRGQSDLPLLEERLRRPLDSEQVDRCLTDHRDVLGAEAGAVLRGLPGRIDELADGLARLPLTVVHGDLHLDNVLIDDTGRATIVDWGRPQRAPAVVDIARCFVEVIDATPDAAPGREFLDHYLERLDERGVAAPDEHVLRAIESAQLLWAPGVIRWACSPSLERGSRQWWLLRNSLTRLGRLIV